jgi:acetyltransferase EpsM
MGKRLIIWGAKGHASVIADIIRLRGEYEIVGFIDNVNSARHGTSFCGAPILGGDELLTILQKDFDVFHLILGFGDCGERLRLSTIVLEHGFQLVSAIHPTAIIASSTEIGFGTVIAAGAVVNPGARIGHNVIVNTCASVDHDCIIKDGVHISPGAHLGGHVTIERGTWIGIGSVVKDHVHIGEFSVVGAGSAVVSDIPGHVVAYGVPAKPRRENS